MHMFGASNCVSFAIHKQDVGLVKHAFAIFLVVGKYIVLHAQFIVCLWWATKNQSWHLGTIGIQYIKVSYTLRVRAAS